MLYAELVKFIARMYLMVFCPIYDICCSAQCEMLGRIGNYSCVLFLFCFLLGLQFKYTLMWLMYGNNASTDTVHWVWFTGSKPSVIGLYWFHLACKNIVPAIMKFFLGRRWVYGLIHGCHSEIGQLHGDGIRVTVSLRVLLWQAFLLCCRILF